MLITKLHTLIFILLLLCTIQSDGSLLIAILLKIVFLKGALFLGTPMAVGSFLMGQQMGIFSGGLLGSYTMLKAAHRYHQKQKQYWTRPIRPVRIKFGFKRPQYGPPKYRPPATKNYGPPVLNSASFKKPSNPGIYSSAFTKGYGLGSTFSTGLNHAYGDGSKAPAHDSTHFHYHQPTPAPNIFQRLMSLPSMLTNVKKPQPIQSQMHTWYPGTGFEAHVDGQGGPGEYAYGGLGSSSDVSKGEDSPLAAPMGLGEFNSFEFQFGPSPGTSAGTTTSQAHAQPIHDYDDGPLEQVPSIAYDVSESYPFTSNNAQKKSDPTPGRPGYSKPNHKQATPPNEVLMKYIQLKLEEKSRLSNDIGEKQEAKQLIQLLRQAYIGELARSMEAEMMEVQEGFRAKVGDSTENSDTATALPDFKPLPTFSPSYNKTDEPENQQDSTRPKRQSASASASASNKKSLRDGVAAVLLNSAAVPAPSPVVQTPTTPTPESIPEELSAQFSFISSEIKQFFLVLSMLDQDSCLQKLVCDVHGRSGAGLDLSEYERNIVSTFRILNLLLPSTPSPSDATTKYRLASRLGEMGGTDICSQYYTTCGYSTEQIIQMGNQVDETVARIGRPTRDASGTDKMVRPTNDQVTMPLV